MNANLNTDTAYLRLKAHPTAKKLDEIHTPNLIGVHLSVFEPGGQVWGNPSPP
jgi:hypothetical protein